MGSARCGFIWLQTSVLKSNDHFQLSLHFAAIYCCKLFKFWFVSCIFWMKIPAVFSLEKNSSKMQWAVASRRDLPLTASSLDWRQRPDWYYKETLFFLWENGVLLPIWCVHWSPPWDSICMKWDIGITHGVLAGFEKGFLCTKGSYATHWATSLPSHLKLFLDKLRNGGNNIYRHWIDFKNIILPLLSCFWLIPSQGATWELIRRPSFHESVK